MLFYSTVVTGSKWRREGGVAFGCNITDVSADTRRRRVGPLELRWQRKKEQGIGWRLDYDEHLDAKRTLGTRDGETRRWLVFHLFICYLASTAHFEKQVLLSSGSHPTQLRFEAASSARSWGRERSVIRLGLYLYVCRARSCSFVNAPRSQVGALAVHSVASVQKSESGLLPNVEKGAQNESCPRAEAAAFNTAKHEIRTRVGSPDEFQGVQPLLLLKSGLRNCSNGRRNQAKLGCPRVDFFGFHKWARITLAPSDEK